MLRSLELMHDIDYLIKRLIGRATCRLEHDAVLGSLRSRTPVALPTRSLSAGQPHLGKAFHVRPWWRDQDWRMVLRREGPDLVGCLSSLVAS